MSTVTTYNKSINLSMTGNPTEESKATYRIYLENGADGWIIVTSPDLQSLTTQGRTEDEAIKNAYEAVELLLEEASSKKDFNLVVIETD